MSLNFFKTKTQKTDATLQFQSVLQSLDKKVDTSNTLNIDEFVQQENIHLRQHQDYYKAVEPKENIAPKSISKEDKLDTQDTRTVVNSLIELSYSMPEIKSTAEEYSSKIKDTLQNSDTITKIESITPTLP